MWMAARLSIDQHLLAAFLALQSMREAHASLIRRVQVHIMNLKSTELQWRSVIVKVSSKCCSQFNTADHYFLKKKNIRIIIGT